MKRFLSLVFLFFFINNWAQNPNVRTLAAASPIVTSPTQAIAEPLPPDPNSVSFEYDDAGNQVVRKPIYLLARPSKPADIKPDEPKTFLESDIYSDVLYYPNPTIEILYVKWKNENETFVDTMQLFNLNGQQMSQINDLKNVETTEIDFQRYPAGFYELVLVYSNSKKKTLKIIKQ